MRERSSSSQTVPSVTSIRYFSSWNQAMNSGTQPLVPAIAPSHRSLNSL